MSLKIKISSILLMIGINCLAQSEVTKLVGSYMKASMEKRSTTDLFKKIFSSENTSVLYAITPFTSDSITGVRMEAYNLLSQLGNVSQQDEVRKKIVILLIKGCHDNDSGICGIVISKLCQFHKNDFDNEAKYELTALTKEKLPYFDKIIKLIGFVGINDIKPAFRKMLEEKRYPNNQARWALHLALARMGELDETNFCVQKVQSQKINDDVVYDLVPDLVYTRQKSAFEYLFNIIESDDKNCSSANPDSNAKIICAFRVIEQMAPFVKDFPVETDISGDLKTKNYNTALLKVREWIKSNRNTYQIIDDTF